MLVFFGRYVRNPNAKDAEADLDRSDVEEEEDAQTGAVAAAAALLGSTAAVKKQKEREKLKNKQTKALLASTNPHRDASNDQVDHRNVPGYEKLLVFGSKRNRRA